MEIKFANSRQCEIADLLWTADSQRDVDAVIQKYGREAVVVQEMMIAAAYDEVTEISEEVQDLLAKFG